MSKKQAPVVLKVDTAIQLLNNWAWTGATRALQAPQLILWAKMTFPFEGYSSVSSASGHDEMQGNKVWIETRFVFIFYFQLIFFSSHFAGLEQSFAWQQTSPCAQTRHFQIWFWWPNLAIIILLTFPYVSPRVVVLLWSFFFCYAREFGIVAVIWWCLRQVKIRRAMLMHYWP